MLISLFVMYFFVFLLPLVISTNCFANITFWLFDFKFLIVGAFSSLKNVITLFCLITCKSYHSLVMDINTSNKNDTAAQIRTHWRVVTVYVDASFVIH